MGSDAKLVDCEAFAVISDLLDGDAALDFFHCDPEYYTILAKPLEMLAQSNALRSVLQENLRDALTVAVALASHPSFVSTAGVHDAGSEFELWTSLLDLGAQSIDADPGLAPFWSALVAAAVRRPDIARWLLSNPSCKQMLVKLAEGDPVGTGFSWEVSLLLSAQRDYSIVALHNLAQFALAEGAGAICLGWGCQLSEYENIPVSSMPFRPAVKQTLPSRPFLTVCLCSFGGLVWGALRSACTLQILSRTALCAGIFQAALEGKHEATTRYWASDVASGYPNYRTLPVASGIAAIDIGVTCSLLWYITGPCGARFTAGGWLLGQFSYISLLACGSSGNFLGS